VYKTPTRQIAGTHAPRLVVQYRPTYLCYWAG